MSVPFVLLILTASLALETSSGITFYSRLIHRFSDEVKAVRVSRGGSVNDTRFWPERKSVEYYELLVKSDLQRQKLKFGPRYQFVFPSEGSDTMSFGNDFGWLHYTWIDIGTPKMSFLVALDAGSDLLWVPCDCVQCAPLSASYYSSLDRDLNEYSPSHSSTSKQLSCSHQLCELGSNCKSSSQACPYTIDYYTQNTSTSGMLVEDVLHLATNSGDSSSASLQASVVIGCGMKQSGGYLEGVAPDGLMGLGLKEISIPSFLAKAGLIRNSFSMCFNDEDSGRILFGDQGPSSQNSTPFLTLDGNYSTYIVGVEACCVGKSCLTQTSFQALIDSGSSFSFLPTDVYKRTAEEFNRQISTPISSFEGYPFEYCYRSSSSDSPNVPSLKLMFPQNNSFFIHNPVFMIYGIQGIIGFCLAIQPADGDIGTIGQNFMTGYNMVFDRENLKLGWWPSKCDNPRDENRMPNTPVNPLPTEQQGNPRGHAVSPAVAGRTPSKLSSATPQLFFSGPFLLKLTPLMLLLHWLDSALRG